MKHNALNGKFKKYIYIYIYAEECIWTLWEGSNRIRENWVMRTCMMCGVDQILLREYWHGLGREHVCWYKYIQGFCRENLREEDHLQDLVVDGRIILKWMFKNGMYRIRFLWLRLWPRCGLLWTRRWTSAFHRMMGIYLDEELSASKRDFASWSYMGLRFLPGSWWNNNVRR